MTLRGELRWADLCLPRGSAPAFRRPVLIVSADQYNRSNLSTVTIAVVTTNLQLAALPGTLGCRRSPQGSKRSERIGALPDWLMAQVDAGLGRALALVRL